MSWNLQLDSARHDLVISNGSFARVTGSNEVTQRVKVALWHYQGEYFLDTTQGVPYYQDILGAKTSASVLGVILRRQILLVPNVLRVSAFSINYNNATRQADFDCVIEVARGPNEPSQIVNIRDGVQLS